MAATGIAATFAASLAILVSPVDSALAAPPATQVDVVNPATSPALTRSVDDPGRIAYQSTAACVLDTDACAFDFPAVPQNHRLVVQHVSGLLLGNVTRALAILIGGANGAFPLLSLLPHTRVRASLISRFCNISMPVCALPDRRRRRHSDLVFERDNIRIFARLYGRPMCQDCAVTGRR